MMTADIDGARVEATPGARAECPLCYAPVTAKCGELISWHWAHLNTTDCDPWAEPDSAWHRDWQAQVPLANREVVMPPHRADIVTTDGTIVELQHSSISVAEIRERQNFYGSELIWIFDATEAWEDDRIKLWWYRRKMFFRWKHPRKSVIACMSGKFLLDLGTNLLVVDQIDFEYDEPTTGSGKLKTREEIIKALNP